MEVLDRNMEKMHELCRKHNVERLFVFGSVLTSDFNSTSDIDMIVDFSDIDVFNYADNYYELKFSLEDLFGREVDLLEETALKNPYFRESVNEQKQLVYG
jgi:predicted nucleotidyltransferase